MSLSFRSHMQKHNVSVIFVLLMLLLSILVHYGRIGASFEGTDLSSDVQHYASLAAAMKYPDVFAQDPALDEAEYYEVGATAATWLIPYLTDGTNLGLAYLQLTGPQFFLHAIAFYLLGLVLLKKPWQSILFTMVLTQAYWMPWGTYWGNGYVDWLPRSTFEVFYAFFIICAFRILHTPRYWPYFMASIGLMVYIHSISTIPAAFGFWLAFALHRPQQSPMKQHLLWIFFCGLCFLAVISPFVIKFLRTGITLTPEDVSLMHETLVLRYNVEFTEYWAGLKDFLLRHILPPLFPVGIAGYWVLRTWGDKEEKQRALLFAIWTAAALFCAVLYFVDQEVARVLQRRPYEFEFVRVLRFWIFFAICLSFMGLHCLWKKIPDTPKARNILTGCFVILSLSLFLGGRPHKLINSLSWYWNSADEQRYQEAYAENIARTQMLDALEKYTPQGSLIFDPLGDRAIRYKALRAMVYNWKDCSIYYYAKDMEGLRFWYALQNQLKSSPTAYMDVAMQSKAHYLVSHRLQDKEALEKLGSIVWQNASYILVKLERS